MNSASLLRRRFVSSVFFLTALTSTLPVTAQLYSVNAVGYVDVSLAAGSNFIANPLLSRNGTVSNLFPALPVGSYIKRWNPAIQDFGSTNYLTSSGWSDPGATVLLPEGFVLWTPSPAQVSFTGELYQGSVTGRMALQGIHILGVMPRRSFFICGNFSECMDSSFPPLDTIYYQWNPAQQRFSIYFYFDDSIGWMDEFGNPANPTITPGQSGLFYVPTTFWLLGLPAPTVPPPLPGSAVSMANPRRTETNVSFQLSATNESAYGVWRSTNLAQRAWQHLAMGTSSVGTATIVLDDAGRQSAYYRIGQPWTESSFTPVLLEGGRTNGQFSFSFCVSSNTVYAVDRTTTLNPAMWNPIAVIAAGEKSCLTFTDSNAVTARAYYRLRQTSP